ncbi:hypothetical protein RclHR1_12150010 [Rhizophagus clarus]|uniref:Uncharacterized protein n=1 Tax=Rhizophagus clarus TaxID=94130 RepID=A0A2Z6Q7W9_9GLOM|nr:hypothetical protein RclHR1_12150010 [Rhizophagus clarus]
MDMNILSPASHQSTFAQPHTTAINSPIATTSKGKGKKKNNKHITISEEDIDKEFRFSVDSEADNAGKEKRLKVQDAEAAQVITRYQTPSGCQFVQDILIYDVPAKWDNYELLSHLSTWGNVISISTKRQRKYKTVRCKLVISEFFQNYEAQWMAPLAGITTRWFLANWNLAERKERERFQAVIYDPPESMNTASLTAPQHLTFLSELNRAPISFGNYRTVLTGFGIRAVSVL